MLDVLTQPAERGRYAGMSTLDLIDAEGDCWEWTASTASHGYGKVRRKDTKRIVPVHRLVYEVLVGEIPEGKELHHLCENPICCNPDHLMVVTHAENMGFVHDRCRVHDDWYIHPTRNTRHCRPCHNEWKRQYRSES